MAIQELLAETKKYVDWYCNANNVPTEAIRVLKLSQLAEEYPPRSIKTYAAIRRFEEGRLSRYCQGTN